VHVGLLASLLNEPYFTKQPPKSTGRDGFNGAWLDARLPSGSAMPSDADVMATLAELTARTCADALLGHTPGCRRLMVCGGGAFNDHLMQALAKHLPELRVGTTADAGMPPDHVEALTFAWLAACRLAGHPGNLPAVTGARGMRVLGSWYSAPH